MRTNKKNKSILTEADIEAIKNDVASKIKNGENIVELSTPFISYSNYRARLENKISAVGIENCTVTEQFIYDIDSVDFSDDGVRIHRKTHGMIYIRWDGYTAVYNVNGKIQSHGFPMTAQERYRIALPCKRKDPVTSISGCNRSMFIERVVLIAHSINIDRIPVCINELDANMMDGSGSFYTARLRGISDTSFVPQNIEWCLHDDNTTHGHTLKIVYEKTGRRLRASAKDACLKEIARIGDADLINWYIDYAHVGEV